jgi:probable DNA repair protein
MGSQAAEIDAWLRDGGLLVTASERAARAITAAFHRTRQAEGQLAWPSPNVLNFNSFARSAWEERTLDGRLLLNPTQELALWADIVAQSRHMATLLEGPRHRLAKMAMEAHGMLAFFASNLLQGERVRSTWEREKGVFSGWLSAFNQVCNSGNLLSASRVPLELVTLLQNETANRPPLLLAGFDRILPVQRSLFDAWGAWRQAECGEPAAQVSFHSADSQHTELAACAQWCSSQLQANPHRRLLVVAQDAGARRGEIERAFLPGNSTADSLPFEFSLGIPIGQLALARGAALLLRWLSGPIEEQELDWLFSTGQTAADPQESLALQAYMRALRRRGLERTQWTLDAFLSQTRGAEMLPASWAQRMRQARTRLAEQKRRAQSPLDWATFVPHLLQIARWPGWRPLSSSEFQALNRWQQALDDCASLGFDARRFQWNEFLSQLSRTLEETLFAPESRDAPILIAGAAESAGLTADAIWFLGASEDAWPARGATHPLLPLEVQRETGMPHASPQIDWELARAVTTRLLASASEVHFSYARQGENSETRPSRIVEQFAGEPKPLLGPPPIAEPITIEFQDFSRVPFPPGKAGGGASVLTNQSQCPFKAFATSRLAAQGWEMAIAGLTPAQRGQLLHAVMHTVWAGPPAGIRTHQDLQDLNDRSAFVARHVRRVFRDEIPAGLRERMPRRYLELEEQRLTDLVCKWLEYESSRWPFEVVLTEAESAASPAGLTLKLRLDRIDKLNDGSLLVIDYKTGNVWPKAWDLPRPDDVQLPLYAGFALDPTAELSGLVFAKIRPGGQSFAGRVGDAKVTLLPDLGATSSLVQNPFTAEQLLDWRDCIEQLAMDFLAGRAEVNPREYPKTCERCGLQTLCRIQEHQAITDDESEGEEAADE